MLTIYIYYISNDHIVISIIKKLICLQSLLMQLCWLLCCCKVKDFSLFFRQILAPPDCVKLRSLNALLIFCKLFRRAKKREWGNKKDWLNYWISGFLSRFLKCNKKAFFVHVFITVYIMMKYDSVGINILFKFLHGSSKISACRNWSLRYILVYWFYNPQIFLFAKWLKAK